MGRVVLAARAELRLQAAADWLAARGPDEEVVVVGASYAAASELIRRVAWEHGAGFGWHRITLGRLAAELAKLELATRDLATLGGLPTEALCARVLHRLRDEGTLGRFAAVADRPGLPRALARTLGDLRMAGVTRVPEDPPLDAALRVFGAELAGARLADRAEVFETATSVASIVARHPLLDLPIVFVDVPVRSLAERRLIEALAARAPDVLATVPAGDERTRAHLADVIGEPARPDMPTGSALDRVQRHLFAGDDAGAVDAGPLDASVQIYSAPGESRECVELARRVLREAERGVPFDRMAVLLRTPGQYRVHLEEALGRAGVLVQFEQGTVLPDPSGRAFLALLGCAAETLSARRFAEYVSLGEVPAPAADGTPPLAPPPGERWVPPDEELLPGALAAARAGEAEVEVAVDGGMLRAPWRWERLLVEAAVIGGRERWERRLAGLAARLALPDDAGPRDGETRERARADLDHLRRFALPLLDDLARLPRVARWGEWIDRLSALATRALREPQRVLETLAALAPMSEVAAVTLSEVQLVLTPRLVDLVARPTTRRYGRLLVAPIEAVRGFAFDVVFVPGLAERMFPQKIAEDPLLLDAMRVRLDGGLAVRDDRLTDERLALRLAIGAARERVVLSYPRIDLDQGRPRVPSFYGLEVLEAAEGTLPGFDELGRRADVTGAARIGWPAPADRLDAIDEAEHDLALLDGWLRPRAPSDSSTPIGSSSATAAPATADAPSTSRDAASSAPAASSRSPDPRSTANLFARTTASGASRDGRPAPRPGYHAPVGVAAYLLAANPHLARSLRARARRWTVRAWKPADGLIVSTDPARAALAAHHPARRSFSPTALEHLAQCPYRFALRTILKLEPRDEPEAIEALGPLERGSLIHDVQYELLAELRDAGELPIALDGVAPRLQRVLGAVAARYRDELCPAIDRVWDDGIAAIEADLREWLRRMTEDPEWVPERFELAFGPVRRGARDPGSVEQPVVVASGLSLRGSIDLVERRGTADHRVLRATDYKTGAAKVQPGSVIAGGTSLQPVLYALVLERLFPDAAVAGGRLSYCTSRGQFRVVDVPLDGEARESVQLVADTLARHFDDGFFPAAPDKGACAWCDFRSICGPYEELRQKTKATEPLAALVKLRSTR